MNKNNYIEYSPDLDQEIFELLENQPRKSLFWKWQYLQNPTGPRPCPMFILQNKSEGKPEIIAFNGIVPMEVKIGDKLHAAYWSCDTFVKPSFRGQGIGQELTKKKEETFPLLLAFNPTPVNRHNYEKHGWFAYDRISEFYYVLSANSPLEYIKLLNQTLLRIKGYFQHHKVAPNYKYELAPASEVIEELAAKWKHYREQYTNAVERSSEYLNWRYVSHPTAEYRAVVTRDREDNKLHSAVLYRLGKNLRLVDYIGPNDDIGTKIEMVKCLLTFATSAESKVKMLGCITSHRGLAQALSICGFRRVPSTIAVLMKCNLEKYSELNHSQLSNDWFFMGGDSDLESIN